MSEFGFSVYRGEPSIGHIGEDNFKACFIGAQARCLLGCALQASRDSMLNQVV